MGNLVSALVFQAPDPTYTESDVTLWLTSSLNHKVPAHYIKQADDRITLLFSHGNAEDMGMLIPFFTMVAELWGANILLYDYSGYGPTEYTPTEQSVYADVEAAYKFLIDSGTSWRKIVAFGRSLGSGPTVHLAAKYPVGGIIIQSGILSVHRVVFNNRLTVPGDMFCNWEKIKKVGCPVLVIHGVMDEIVPYHHGRALYEAAPCPVTPLWVEGAGHNNVEPLAGESYFEFILRFLDFISAKDMPNYFEDPRAFAQIAESVKLFNGGLGSIYSNQVLATSQKKFLPKLRRARTNAKSLSSTVTVVESSFPGGDYRARLLGSFHRRAATVDRSIDPSSMHAKVATLPEPTEVWLAASSRNHKLRPKKVKQSSKTLDSIARTEVVERPVRQRGLIMKYGDEAFTTKEIAANIDSELNRVSSPLLESVVKPKRLKRNRIKRAPMKIIDHARIHAGFAHQSKRDVTIENGYDTLSPDGPYPIGRLTRKSLGGPLPGHSPPFRLVPTRSTVPRATSYGTLYELQPPAEVVIPPRAEVVTPPRANVAMGPALLESGTSADCLPQLKKYVSYADIHVKNQAPYLPIPSNRSPAQFSLQPVPEVNNGANEDRSFERYKAPLPSSGQQQAVIRSRSPTSRWPNESPQAVYISYNNEPVITSPMSSVEMQLTPTGPLPTDLWKHHVLPATITRGLIRQC